MARSQAGYRRHLERGTVPCGMCLNEISVYQWERKYRGKCAAGLGWPVLPGRNNG
jgi:hypothetical protein